MKVLKFGGSSLATPDRLRVVGGIVLDAARRDPVVVVVSAFQGITDQLLSCARLAEAGDPGCEAAFDRIAKRHRVAVQELLPKSGQRRVLARVDAMLATLHDAVQGIQLLRYGPPAALDLVASFGERLSAVVVASFLDRTHPAAFADAREFVITDDQFTQAGVLFARTNRAVRAHFSRIRRLRGARVIPVVTGFIGSTTAGQTTTLGRNGSDYSAAIVGAAIGASVIEIWTDVDGVLSADPRVVPSAFPLRAISYEEAMELSYFGAKVVHSATMGPAVSKSIPILIKNTLNPSAPGTVISRKRADEGELAHGITSIGDLSLLTLRGVAMVGVPGIAERLFRSLAARRVSVVLISQASSEHTICFAVRATDGDRAVEAIHEEFRQEIDRKLVSVDVRKDQAILAVVGDGMQGRPGVAGKVFDSLGRQNINISAIAQGASERNISCVIDARQQTRALNVIHNAFFEKRKRLALAVVGVGNIGGALLRQLRQQRPYLLSHGFDVRVVVVADDRRFVVDGDGLNLNHWEDALAASRRRTSIDALVRSVAELQLANAALIDCTAAPSVVDAYPEFIEANCHVITPNKRANVLPWRRYSALMELLAQRRKYFLYEANVGAGLPVLSTLRDLIDSGDEILKIEGVFSGTLSYLFNTFDGTTPFSALVRQALELGFTEPDPRDDLSGEDVARKLLILARQIGMRMDIDDVQVEGVVPKALRAGPFGTRFFTDFARYDDDMSRRQRAAASRGCVLRYVGTLEGGRARAGLKEFPRDHSIAATKGSDNVIAFTTSRYSRTPLVVQGPGAGADVTAMGVFSDILKLLHYLP
jgi:bifunctional aspartokinase / homoserine dehydrogenase 1